MASCQADQRLSRGMAMTAQTCTGVSTLKGHDEEQVCVLVDERSRFALMHVAQPPSPRWSFKFKSGPAYSYRCPNGALVIPLPHMQQASYD
jgi:hypothetical protein